MTGLVPRASGFHARRAGYRPGMPALCVVTPNRTSTSSSGGSGTREPVDGVRAARSTRVPVASDVVALGARQDPAAS